MKVNKNMFSTTVGLTAVEYEELEETGYIYDDGYALIKVGDRKILCKEIGFSFEELEKDLENLKKSNKEEKKQENESSSSNGSITLKDYRDAVVRYAVKFADSTKTIDGALVITAILKKFENELFGGRK